MAAIVKRHARSCASLTGSKCSCRPRFQASVWSARDGKKIRRQFRTQAEAKSWRADALVQLGKGKLRAPTQITFRQAAEGWLRMARSGAIRTRSGSAYKPSALRGYEQALRLRVLPDLGGARLSAITRSDLQRLVGRLQAQELSASTIRNTLLPLRTIFRDAELLTDGGVPTNPTTGLRLPAVRGGRDRIATPQEAETLIVALPKGDRALWATALYAGLRLGELQALRWQDVDLAQGVIKVERSWDPKEGVIDPKSRSGRRSVPVAGILRDHLVEHRMNTAWGEGFVFGRQAERPFNASSVHRRAKVAWKRLELRPITLHEARHTAASWMIAAGLNAKALSTYLGHANISITFDRYGHMMPGSEDEATERLDAYLSRANHAAGAHVA
jgi:integrase